MSLHFQFQNHGPAESVRVQRGALFQSQAKLQAIICGGVSACRAWGRVGALHVLLSRSSQSKTCKPPRLIEEQIGAELGWGE